jgi:hypothetical protein
MPHPKREEVVKEIGNCFSKKRPEKDKLCLFADELLKNLEGITAYGFGKALQIFSDESREKNWLDREEIKKLIKKTERFSQDYAEIRDKVANQPYLFLYSAWTKHHQQSGDWIDGDGGPKRNVRYDEDGNKILIFPDKMKLFEEYLAELCKMLQLELECIPAKEGRPIDKSQQDFLSLLYVMTECLLGVPAGISSKATPFSRITEYCLSLVDGKVVENFPYVMSFCFDDYATIRNMAYKYKEYGRLDLFVEHVLKTKFVDSFYEEFEDEWADWKKPINFNKLLCAKNSQK